MIFSFFQILSLKVLYQLFGDVPEVSFQFKDFGSQLFDWKVFEFDKLAFY